MTVKTLNKTIANSGGENDNLNAEMAWLRQRHCGSSSERRLEPFPEQMGLFDLEVEKTQEIINLEIVPLPPKSDYSALVQTYT